MALKARPHDHFSVLAQVSRRAHWTPWVVLILGATAIGLVLLMTWMKDRWVVRNVERQQALAEIRTSVAEIHLWIEEYVSGDDVSLPKRMQSFERALDLAQALKAGGRAPDGRTLTAPPTETMLAETAKLQLLLLRFYHLSWERSAGYDARQDVGIGSLADREFDRTFDQLDQQSAVLAALLGERLNLDQRRSRRFFYAILLGWAALILTAAFALFKKEEHRLIAEAAWRRSEERLLISQKMEAVGRLAGGVAHDINNYLAAITGHAELVKMRAETGSRTAEKMDSVIATCFRASDLIKRLLAFSRRQPTQPQIVSLSEIVSGLEKMLRQLVGEDIELTLRLSEGIWPVLIDPSQVEQIVVNLVVNARDAMPQGGRITVEIENSPALVTKQAQVPVDSVMLAVSDNGPGIPEEIRDKIYEPFFTTKRDSGSSGLGLATVYGIVDQNRGYLWLYSEPGKGATFKIYLPRSVGEQPVRAPVERQKARRGSERILLVEDNLDFRHSSAELLAELGYTVTAAMGGREALDLIARGLEVDLVISDVVMPGMSGREFVDQLREDHPDMPVIFVSGYTDNVVVRHGIQVGEMDFLQKPFGAEQLGAKVREVLERERR